MAPGENNPRRNLNQQHPSCQKRARNSFHANPPITICISQLPSDLFSPLWLELIPRAPGTGKKNQNIPQIGLMSPLCNPNLSVRSPRPCGCRIPSKLGGDYGAPWISGFFAKDRAEDSQMSPKFSSLLSPLLLLKAPRSRT